MIGLFLQVTSRVPFSPTLSLTALEVTLFLLVEVLSSYPIRLETSNFITTKGLPPPFGGFFIGSFSDLFAALPYYPVQQFPDLLKMPLLSAS